MREEAVVSEPEIEKLGRGQIAKALELDESILRISRKGELALQCGADKALMIVRSRVEKVADDFFARPLFGRAGNSGFRFTEFAQQRLGLAQDIAQVSG